MGYTNRKRAGGAPYGFGGIGESFGCSTFTGVSGGGVGGCCTPASSGAAGCPSTTRVAYSPVDGGASGATSFSAGGAAGFTHAVDAPTLTASAAPATNTVRMSRPVRVRVLV